MPTNYPHRLYATLKKTEDLLRFYTSLNLEELSGYTRNLLSLRRGVSEALLEDIMVVAAPSRGWEPSIVGAEDLSGVFPDDLIIAYDFQKSDTAQEFINFVVNYRGEALDGHGNAFLDVGADPGGNAADHWCPGPANLAAFGHRADARRTVNADALASHLPNPLTGQGVNVVIIDQGLDKTHIDPNNWGGGLGPAAGMAPRTSHGMMVARNILDLAPDAVLYDVPLIPPRITNIPLFTSTAHFVYEILLILIELLRPQNPQWSGPWILVNAWAIFDRRTDPLGNYTENKAFGGHPLIKIVTRAVQPHHLDVIFAAGNCGQFCPSPRCYGIDRGPGHSIWGANAHPLVITAGAVRTDEMWLGYSSQGPGPVALAANKPDLCAPSQFCETTDAAVVNSGTSTACAMTAGVVAALRSNPAWDQITVPPALLKAALINSARQTQGSGWHDRLGFGILDAGEAIPQLP